MCSIYTAARKIDSTSHKSLVSLSIKVLKRAIRRSKNVKDAIGDYNDINVRGGGEVDDDVVEDIDDAETDDNGFEDNSGCDDNGGDDWS